MLYERTNGRKSAKMAQNVMTAIQPSAIFSSFVMCFWSPVMIPPGMTAFAVMPPA